MTGNDNGYSSEEMDFSSIVPIRIPVTFPNGDKYVLCEASEGTAKKYQDRRLACITLGPSGKPQKLTGLAELQPFLVSMCLFPADKDGEPTTKSVVQTLVESLPSKMVKKLHKAAMRISDLDEISEERTLLEKVMSIAGSPVTFADLRTWINTVEDEEFASLKDWMKETPEDNAKNERVGTTGGSN